MEWICWVSWFLVAKGTGRDVHFSVVMSTFSTVDLRGAKCRRRFQAGERLATQHAYVIGVQHKSSTIASETSPRRWNHTRALHRKRCCGQEVTQGARDILSYAEVRTVDPHE